MGLVDDVRKMKAEGKSEQEIAGSLKDRGVSDREISEAISQADIKEAISGEGQKQDFNQPQGQNYSMDSYSTDSQVQQPAQESWNSGEGGSAYQGQLPNEGGFSSQGYGEMQPSIVSNEGEVVEGAEPYAQGAGEGYGGEYQGGYEQYPQYQQYQGGMSSDVMTEIAEQVVGEKMSQLSERMERVLDFRTVAEAKIESIDERLKRLEKIIDKLQLSILERVGEYIGDVKSLKKELIETQKSFKALSKK